MGHRISFLCICGLFFTLDVCQAVANLEFKAIEGYPVDGLICFISIFEKHDEFDNTMNPTMVYSISSHLIELAPLGARRLVMFLRLSSLCHTLSLEINPLRRAHLVS